MECHLYDNFKDRICRLCLTYCDDLSYELSETKELYNKITTFAQAKITLNNAFPNNICNTCVQTIEEMFTFCEKVKENQCKLNYLFNLGENNLENFYVTLNYDTKVKLKINNIKEDSSDDDFSSTFKTGTRQNDFFTEDSTPNVELLNNKELNIDMHNNKKCKSTKKDEDMKENIDNEPGKDLKENAMTFKCFMCFQLFENKADLRKHYIKHMNLYEQDNKEMDGRFIIHNQDINKFLCAICGNMYENRLDIVAHLECHKDGRPFCCKICGSTYRNVYEMMRHGRVHSGQRLHCSYKCGFNTAYRGALKDHEQRHTKTDKKYKCEKCGKGFQVRSWYEQHQNIHSGEKPYVCKICGVGFHMHRYLTSHTSKLHPQSFEIKRYACMHCSLPCGNKNSLTIHMEKEHGIKAIFLCDLCGKALPNSMQLNYHKKIHLGVKPFSCSSCSKTFGRKFHLKIHEQTHTGEKNHACSKCSKRFIQKSSLNRHIKRHHPEDKPKGCIIE